MLILIIILVLVLGGGGGYYGNSRWGYGGGCGHRAGHHTVGSSHSVRVGRFPLRRLPFKHQSNRVGKFITSPDP